MRERKIQNLVGFNLVIYKIDKNSEETDNNRKKHMNIQKTRRTKRKGRLEEGEDGKEDWRGDGKERHGGKEGKRKWIR